MSSRVLVTGGMGYIGSHACVALSQSGYKVLILDNLSNCHKQTLQGMAHILGGVPDFIEGDIRDRSLLDQIFSTYDISAVMNFAGLKSVAESIVRPLSYYSNNVSGLVTLLKAMDAAEIRTLIFSSSATVYGDPATIPIPEDTPRVPLSPYARSKIAAEDVLLDLYNSDSRWKIAQLRYFNPVGAHESGFIGENPIGIATNLMPSILSVATGETPRIFVFGGDYPTPDGTCIRDYIHVMDLVEGHIAALSHLENNGGLLTCNLGTGEGVSVLQLITAFEQANSCVVPYKVTARRQGDIVQSWANPDRALKLLGWKTQRDLFSMCRDAWRWHKRDLHK